MKFVRPAIAASAALIAPGFAEARQITIETTLKNYGGNGAYVVLYVTDAAGKYRGTLWMAGGKAKYYRHLSDWQRASGGAAAEINDGLAVESLDRHVQHRSMVEHAFDHVKLLEVIRQRTICRL